MTVNIGEEIVYIDSGTAKRGWVAETDLLVDEGNVLIGLYDQDMISLPADSPHLEPLADTEALEGYEAIDVFSDDDLWLSLRWDNKRMSELRKFAALDGIQPGEFLEKTLIETLDSLADAEPTN